VRRPRQRTQRSSRLLAAGLAAGAALIVAAPGAAIASASASASTSGITFRGPHMYIPGTTNSHYSQASAVTVTQDTHLVNQMIQVSWTGFSPSSATLYDPASTDYPVMVAECNTARPTSPDQCYDATNSGQTATFGADGPGNTAYGTTVANGSGAVDIEIYTSVQNQFLGCSATHQCSLVIVPSQGGDSLDYSPPHCAGHTQDNQATDLGQYAFTELNNSPNGQCSWAKRIVIPLRFSPTPNGCPLRAANFTAGGSPMLARAMQEWQSGLCERSSPITIQYNSSINEYEARNDYALGLNDIAFTTQPLAPGTSAKHPYAYAPVAISAVSIAYWLDNTVTGQPYTNLKLNARLLAKLLTTSYSYTDDACPVAASDPFGCDNSVDGNPQNLFADPEFKKLNPAITNPADPDGFQVPTVAAGNSDMTWTTTSWISADKDASGFLAGTFDQWGSHVSTSYLGLKYPTDTFTTQDSYFPLSMRYSPTYPLSRVAQYQAQNWEPGNTDQKDPLGNYPALPILTPGQRDLFAFLDEADAADFLFPAAAIKNHAGKYVQPTLASMAAAVKDMTANSDGITRSLNETSNDPKAYPLTMIIYAVVPTGGISHAKAAKIAQFLDYLAGAGQKSGTNPGQLAQGYLPLTSALRKQTLQAAQEVLNQTGNTTSRTTSTPSTSPAPAASRPASSMPSPSPSATNSPEPVRQIAVSFSRPDTAGMSWIVLALLIAGFVFAVSGPAALMYGSPGARATMRSTFRSTRTRIKSIRITSIHITSKRDKS
jgi:hypothetical protein